MLVIGYGALGACAAIEAYDNGSIVLIIEKMAQPGGNSAISSGGFMVPQDGPTALKYLTATYDLANSEKDDELLNTFCKEIMGVKDWMTGLKDGTELWVYGHAGFQNLPGWEVIDKYRLRGKKRSGDCLFDLYRYAVEEKRNIPVMLETPAVQLIQKDGQVVGAVASNKGKNINIKANKGVILTTGGYEFDPESLRTYAQGENYHALGNPGDTGDGLRMAQSMGARLWHMTAHSCPLGTELLGCKAALQVAMMAPSFIWWTRTANGLRTNSLRTVILVATLLIVLIRSLIALRLFLAGSFLTTRHSNADL